MILIVRAGEQFWPRQIVARGDHLVRGVGVWEVPRLIDQDDPAVHVARHLGGAESRDSFCMIAGGKIPEVQKVRR